MKWKIEKMQMRYASQIVNWKYEPPYNLYNLDNTKETVSEMLNDSYYAVIFHNELVGFYCSGMSAQVPIGHDNQAYEESMLDIGLGLKPSWTGKGNGKRFIATILDDIQRKHGSVPIRLTVANFNERAIKLYDNVGFEMKGHFHRGEMKFITMVKK